MYISDAGLALIKKNEGCSLTAYPDPGTGGEPWTIGWGHTGGIRPGQTWTQEQADSQLVLDITPVEIGVTNMLQVQVSQAEFDALCSFAYNVGLDNLRHSTLLRLLNAGDHAGAAEQFGKWIHADGRVLPGLVARRNEEKELFLS